MCLERSSLYGGTCESIYQTCQGEIQAVGVLTDSMYSGTSTRVVNLRVEPYDVYIGRPSKWGNPFTIGRDGTRREVVQKYREWIRNNPDLMGALHELRGKTLGCFCKPESCHGDVLIELLEEKSIMIIPFPDKRYQIIYADPPWSFGGGGVYQDGGRKPRETNRQYRLTKTSVLKELPVNRIADEDCLLFMWVTDQHVPDALELMKSWGFRYCTVAFYWLKQYHTGTTCFNVGCWTMKSVEMVLLGLKGKPMHFKIKRNVKQLVQAERTAHSKKPDEVRNRIVELVGDRPRIELFARQEVVGWDVWGDEVHTGIKMETE